ncbi:phytanoyl-CoA dioxygenase family protein [Haliangium ochraceum]|uniref:Phytanoyl-CoA dioxygenase n=1 Tax=Haliangium ochraceum (strain DSM 14365 / JCM 11303 / SMP-2) TaxID=502025 RepID=D0LQ26_HALO1|nr:phytanoyl-CoA dioxygenase family protein [Haliangium ochraceum]ACY17063.1 phytanoyl-CoA dioxygenase [Haliangium ochraceum DSM 14365]
MSHAPKPPPQQRRLRDARSILSADKSFADPWIGDPTLNRLGLHIARLATSEAIARARARLARGWHRQPEAVATLRRDGVVALRQFSDASSFAALRAEAQARVSEIERAHPPAPSRDRGFGPRRPFDGGFDRYDGSTLNRFIALDPERTPALWQFAQSEALQRLCASAIGMRSKPAQIWLYQTIQGDERGNPDQQKRLHRDTFQPAVKFWYFLGEVRSEDGPFSYVPGSHRLSRARLRWEHERACALSTRRTRNLGGALRIGEDELDQLALPAPQRYPVPANTLLMANVRGFHRREDAAAGARRLALYASLRPSPFVPVPSF